MFMHFLDTADTCENIVHGYTFILNGIFGGKSLQLAGSDGASASFATGSVPISQIYFANLGRDSVGATTPHGLSAVLISYGRLVYQLHVQNAAACQVSLQVTPMAIKVISVEHQGKPCHYSWQALTKARSPGF